MDALYRVAFQPTTTPAYLALACALAGVTWRWRDDLRVADLGCGRGYTANVLAAANPLWTVVGVDRSAAAIADARATAAAARLANVRFVEADLGALDDTAIDALPPLDAVTLHGLWSWVDDGVRAGIVRLLARRLKPGGLAYVGYNALPAAAGDFALQRLLRGFADAAGGGAGEAAAEQAVAALRAVADRLPLPRTAMLARVLAEAPVLEPAFVAHEFLTDHWRPVFHEDLCAALEPARLEFVASTNLFEAVPALWADAAQRAVIDDLPAGAARELVKDLVLPRSFRADVFVRGRVPAPAAALDDVVVAACRALPDGGELALDAGVARATLAPASWAVVRERLRRGPQSLAALREALGAGAPSAAELLALLAANELVLPWRAAAPAASAARFNAAQAARHADGGAAAGHFALAAAAAGGGVPADALDLAIAAAWLDGVHDAVAIASRLHRDDGGLAERVAARLAERLPVWRRFGVV